METSYILTSWTTDTITLGAGLLVARVVLGLYVMAHGAQKLFGWFGGYGLAGTAGFFEQIGFRPGRLFAATAAGSEIAGGVLVILGLGGPVGPALMLSVLIVAMVSVHWQHGVFAASNGVELPLVFAAGAFALVLTGPGLFSLDALLGLEALWAPTAAWAALATGIAVGVANVVHARHQTVQTTEK